MLIDEANSMIPSWAGSTQNEFKSRSQVLRTDLKILQWDSTEHVVHSFN